MSSNQEALTRECPQCGRNVTWKVCVTDAEAQGCAGWKLPYVPKVSTEKAALPKPAD